MQRFQKQLLYSILAAVFVFTAVFTTARAVKAQSNVQVTIKGTLDGVTPDGTIVIDGQAYKLGPGVMVPSSVQIGTVVVITGELGSDSTIIVVTISTDSATATPTVVTTQAPTATQQATAGSATPTATGTASTATQTPIPTDSSVIVVIDGPISKINVNVITIYDIDVQVAPNNPMLNIVQVGDFVRARGNFDQRGVLIAVSLSNVLNPESAVTVSLDGKVQTIQDNIIVIDGLSVKLDPHHPLLGKLKVGDLLHIEGNFEDNGTTIILIVVNITIINPTTLPMSCKVSKNGHVHCSKKPKPR